MIMPPADWRRQPFAVGLIAISDPTGDGDEAGGREIDTSTDVSWEAVTSAHLAVAVATYRAGYFLVHTVRMCVTGGTDGRERGLAAKDWARLRTLARYADPDALFVLGLDHRELSLLEPMATELRLVVHAVPPLRVW